MVDECRTSTTLRQCCACIQGEIHKLSVLSCIIERKGSLWNGTLQLKIGICAGDLVADELLNLDVVLRYKVDGVLFLAYAALACTLDRMGTFKYKRPCFTCELYRECKDLLESCWAEWARHVDDKEIEQVLIKRLCKNQGPRCAIRRSTVAREVKGFLPIVITATSMAKGHGAR